MSGREAFYEQRHANDADYVYASASYDLRTLTRSKGFSEWLSGRRGTAVRLLDVGCGRGQFVKDLTSLLGRAGALPGSPVGLDLIESTPNVFGEVDGFEFVRQDIDGSALPFEDAAFDLVTSNHVIEHIFETEMLMRELRRVVKPDGLAVVSAPNVAAWMNRVLFLFGSQPLGSEVGTETTTYGFWPPFLKPRLERFSPSGHIRDFTPGSLRDLARACGFRTVGYWPQDGGVLTRLNPRFARGLGVVLAPGS
jgi:SAM-dependent methyltransferase